MNKFLFIPLLMMSLNAMAQNVMTPELLWKLGRVTPLGISKDGKNVVYKVTTPSVQENKSDTKFYTLPVNGGNPTEVKDTAALLKDKNSSPDGKYIVYNEEVKMENVHGKDFYPELVKSDVQIYDGLNYRHWDTWNEGKYNHVFYKENKEGAMGIDILKGENFDSPQKPFGGDEDYIWSPDSKSILYVSKKKAGTDYALSTNTNIYEYNLKTGKTSNRTEENLGYDTAPQFSPTGNLTWLQMKRDGYEADKNDLIVSFKGMKMNLTANWDGTVDNFIWSSDGEKIFFVAPVDGTKQLFEVNFPGLTNPEASGAITVRQVTNGEFDVNDLVGFSGDNIIVTRTDMNHAAELFSYNLKKKTWKQLSNVNTTIYNSLALSKTERRYVTTTDGKKMLVWVVLPPNFDASKKYPTLLYCQGGPQSPLTQFYSFRWNLQLMAANGYIVVAPNRRGMQGHGVEWNEQISKDWGGQVIDDYLSAIDAIAKEKYVDATRLGCVGASYGGYSVFYLAGMHNNRFKTFIAHDGVFNTQSMFGTTEEVFFSNWDFGGAYWEKDNAVAQKTYTTFNPMTLVEKWNKPILIIQGGKDFRVPIGQGQEAFQAAQLRGIKSRFLYFPEENHWVLKPQNAQVWQGEFFKWLKETL
ncbi:S9 family peptidase [Flavobacterium bomense]|uniref:S9 family peptidase n=1 Tax=Flavobacterium bomense TaxID=2497483 RepID=A0A3S0PK24_9FLAO|nr:MULTISPECIES: S9 family peptidase [Flavobacterium]RTY76492.1 S9 family peptidase [Flavobacterium sp. LS1R10]RTZ07873.1 S9 family peptidase [Flavobacterium bomense]